MKNIFRFLLVLFVIGTFGSVYYFHRLVSSQRFISVEIDSYRQRKECSCFRSALPLNVGINGKSSLCNDYATYRGAHQRVIAISLFGPKENKMFQFNRSLTFLQELINDLNLIYPDNFLLRVYHDETIDIGEVVCPIECANPNVDFCSITEKKYIPPKIWRFIPVGDPFVDLSKSKNSFESFSFVDLFIFSDES